MVFARQCRQVSDLLSAADFDRVVYGKLFEVIAAQVRSGAPHDPASIASTLTASGRAGGHHGMQLTRALSGATIAEAAPESVGQHHEQRRAFALLDEIARDDAERLAAVWARLEVLLEVHAQAEELFFYPRLLEVGTGGGGQDGVAGEVKDAVKDHNEIRDGVGKVGQQQPGSDQWWAAVRETRKANSDHMAQEEREDLPDFRRNADLQTRHEIALQFLTFESEHAAGITAKDKDPDAYVKRNG